MVLRSEQPDLFEGFAVKEHAAEIVTGGMFQDIKLYCGTKNAYPIAKFNVPGLPDHTRIEFRK